MLLPDEALRFAQSFRVEFKGELTDALIEKLLYELNRIWARREQFLFKKIRLAHQREVQALHRTASNAPKYDEHQARQTISRLKGQLQDAYELNRVFHGERQTRRPPGTEYLSETLKMANKAEVAKRVGQSDNKLLRETLKHREGLQFAEESQKALFM